MPPLLNSMLGDGGWRNVWYLWDNFGERDPRNMPDYFFRRPVRIDYDSAIRADTSRQNFSVAPRHWYVDVASRCDRCREVFDFTAAEQKAWYEEFGFYVDSFPKHCGACRRQRRRLKSLRQEYDRDIPQALTGGDLELKRRVAAVIDQLCESGESLPAKAHDNRRLLARQISKRGGTNTA
jgi:Probable zinc-ribbon domain